MMLNEAFRKAAGLIKPEQKSGAKKPASMAYEIDFSRLSPRQAARQVARSTVAKNASLDGSRLPFAERARYLQEIIENGRQRELGSKQG